MCHVISGAGSNLRRLVFRVIEFNSSRISAADIIRAHNTSPGATDVLIWEFAGIIGVFIVQLIDFYVVYQSLMPCFENEAERSE